MGSTRETARVYWLLARKIAERIAEIAAAELDRREARRG